VSGTDPAALDASTLVDMVERLRELVASGNATPEDVEQLENLERELGIPDDTEAPPATIADDPQGTESLEAERARLQDLSDTGTATPEDLRRLDTVNEELGNQSDAETPPAGFAGDGQGLNSLDAERARLQDLVDSGNATVDDVERLDHVNRELGIPDDPEATPPETPPADDPQVDQPAPADGTAGAQADPGDEGGPDPGDEGGDFNDGADPAPVEGDALSGTGDVTVGGPEPLGDDDTIDYGGSVFDPPAEPAEAFEDDTIEYGGYAGPPPEEEIDVN
jgi:hypothetical protein